MNFLRKKIVWLILAGIILVPWLVSAAVFAIAFRSSFLESLLLGPRIFLSPLEPKLFPVEEISAPESKATCDGTELDMKGLAWSDVEVRTRQWNIYLGSSATAYAYRPFSADSGRSPSGAWAAASAEEWNRATPVRAQEVTSEAGATSREFVYQGKKFRPTGSKWFGGDPKASLSPDGKSLAILSFDGPLQPAGFYFFDVTRRWWNVHIESVSHR